MRNFRLPLWYGILMVFLLVGCAQPPETVPPTDTAVPLIETSTPTTRPTDTSLPGLVVLLAPSQDSGENQVLVEQVALARGLVFEVRQGMTLEETPPNLQVVVSDGNQPDLGEMISGLPQVQFIVLGGSGLPASPNLSVMQEAGALPELAFMAGYIAAVQAEEWRIGIISAGDSTGQTYRDAFFNGVHYFCGICNPVFPPYEPYPLYAEVSPGAGEGELQGAADELISRAVDMVHVDPGLQTDALYQYLAGRGLRIIGADAPPAGMETNWVVSVIATPPIDLAGLLESVLDDQAVGEVGASLQINYTGISDARLTHFKEIISKIESGEIDPVGLVD